MKKSLFALALMSAFVAPAMAGDVSIYGIVDAGIDYTKSGNESLTRMMSGISSESRIGFKGMEKIGKGLTARFVLEKGIELDSGQATGGGAFRRQAWASIASKEMGELRLGRQHTPIYETLAQLDPFSVGLAGNSLAMMGEGQYLIRNNNAVTYISPNLNGLQTQAQYSFSEEPNHNSYRSLGFNSSYSVDDLSLSIAYSNQNIPMGAKQKDILLGATYDFKYAKAHMGLAETKWELDFTHVEGQSRNMLVGVSVPMGKHSMMASWIRSGVKDLEEGNADLFAIGYNYGMSKRTKLYASYGYMSNEANRTINASDFGESARKVNVGVNHSF